jgi:hypothetical protein
MAIALAETLPSIVPIRAMPRVLSALLASALTCPARADSAAISLQAPSACGTAEALRQRVAELAPGNTKRADVVVTSEENAYRLVVGLPGDTRTLRDSDCLALLEAAAVVIALEEPSAATQPVEIAPHVESIAPRVDLVPRAAQRAQVQVPGWLELGGTYGMLPSLSGALGLGAGLRAGMVGGSLGVHYLLPTETAGRPAVRVQGAQATLLFTLVPVPRLQLGVGGRATVLHGRGKRVDQVHSAWLVPWSALLEARITALQRPRDQLGFSAAIGLALRRPQFRVSGHGNVHQPDRLQASLGLFWARDFF